MTEGTPRNPAPPSGGWRGKADINPGTAKLVNRALMTLAALGLLAALGYLLWSWSFGPATRMVCLPVVEYQKLAVPPIPFTEKDVEPFARLPLAEPPTVWWNLGTSADMTKMPNRLEAIGSRPKDTLIFYVCAHGVSSGDKAYLLSSDYLIGSGNERYALDELLDLIRDVPGAMKLLILDVGHIGSDPRLGMMANEFPRMLEQNLAGGRKDSNLWVLSANRPLQLSHVSAQLQRSVFGHQVTEGLLGAADREGGNRDDRVDLGELYRYVCKGVRVRVSDEVGNADAQTPWLLRDGEGPVRAVPDSLLVFLPDEPDDDAAADGTSAADAESDKDTADKEPAARPMPKTLAAARKLHDLIEQRARSRDPSGSDPTWAPVDYAPHQWRVFEELLVSYELQHLYGMSVSEDNLRRLLDDARAEWPEATAGMKSDAEVGFDAAAQGIERAGTIRALVQLKNSLMGVAPYYVRWITDTTQSTAVSQTTVQQQIIELLGGVEKFTDDYEAFEQAGLDAASPADLQSRLESLERQADALRDADAALRQMLDEKVADLAKYPTTRGNPAQIEILLGLPLLSGGQRSRLLDALAKAKWPLPEIVAQTFDADQMDRGAARFAERQQAMLPELAELQAALCRLAQPDEPIAPPPPAADPQPEAYRPFAAQLKAFYQGLPGMVNAVAGGASADPAAMRTAGRRLRMVLACDVQGKISLPSAWPLVRGVLWREVALAGPTESLRLRWREPVDLPLVIRTAGQPYDRATLTLAYDAATLRVESADGAQTIEPDKSITVALGRERTALRYRVVPLADNGRAGTADVEATIHAGAQSGSYKATCLLPSPDAVRLAVYRVGVADLAMDEVSEGRIRLRPFPNRETAFRFELENLSDDAKQIEVRLLGVRNRPWGETPTRAMLFDASGSLRAAVETIVPPVTMELAAHDAPRTIPLASPEATPVAAASPAASAAPAAAAPSPKPTTWACAIYDKTDTDATGPKWLYWLDFWPLVPREYLEIEGDRPSYDADLGRLTTRAHARGTDARGRHILPGDLQSNPIVVTWNPGRGATELKNLRREAQIAAPGAVAELFADVAPEIGRLVDVDLDVDGYPRGLMFQVQCQQNGQILDMQDRIDVRLTSPTPGKAYAIPLAEPIAVGFEIDAPADAFLETDRESARPTVRLEFASAEGAAGFSPVEIATFTSDRRVEVFVPKIGPTGVMMVQTRVGDFEVPTLNRGLENARVRVRVRLDLPNLDLPANVGRREDSVEIIFDGEPPVVRVSPPAETLLGQPMRLIFEVEDLSGLDRIQARLSETREAKFEDADVLVLTSLANNSATNGDNRFSAVLPTDSLKQAGAYWLVWQATDRAGNATRPAAEAVSIRAPQPGTTAPPPTTGSIEGWVLSPEGEPRDGAQVTLSPLGRAAVANAQGKFAFAEVPPGTYALRVEQRIKGQPAATSRQIEVKVGEKTTLDKIELSMWSRDGE